MTEKNSNNIPKEQNNYIYAQIQKINHSLATHQQQLAKIQDLTLNIKRQSKRIVELQDKLKLMEVYHCQNFKNNERLFYAHNNFDQMQKKISVLQQLQFKLINRDFQTQKNLETDIINGMETRLKDIQEQLQRNKTKNNVLAKFRRQISPRAIINSESTKDISVDQGNLKSELKKIQKKLQQFILDKFTILQKRHQQTRNHQTDKTTQMEEYHQEGFTPNHLNKKNKIKKINSAKQIHKLKSVDSQQGDFKNQMNNYYAETSRNDDRIKIERGMKNEPFGRVSLKKKDKLKQKSISAQKSKSSKKQIKKSPSKSIKEKTNLSSVDEYLRLHSGRR